MNRRYFIGFTLSPEAERQARMISQDLHKTFGIKNHYENRPAHGGVKEQKEKYVPHITLKIPFTGLTKSREDLITFLEVFMKGRRDIQVELSDFGHFNIGVVYWDVIQYSEDLTLLQKELCEGLENNVPWVSFNAVEPNGIPHVTVGEGDIRGRFREIYAYLKKKYTKPQHVILSEVHLFEKPTSGHSWESVTSFKLKPSF